MMPFYPLRSCKRCFRTVAIALTATLCILMGAASKASSFITIDNETGYILDKKNHNDKLPVASLTQVALALTLLDWVQVSKHNLDAVVEVPPNAPPQGPANPIGLQSGDRLSLRDLLYLSLLASDAEASLVIANAVGQELPNSQKLNPIGNFVSQMNALATGLEMKHTLFLNPSGLDMPQNAAQSYSSAADLACLARYAYSKPGFAFYVSQKSRDIHLERQGQSMGVKIENTNKLLGTDDIDGVKTGHSQRAGDCIILTSSHKPEVKRVGDTVYTTPRRIITVLLDSPDLFNTGLQLQHRGWSFYNAWASQGRSLKKGKFL